MLGLWLLVTALNSGTLLADKLFVILDDGGNPRISDQDKNAVATGEYTKHAQGFYTLDISTNYAYRSQIQAYAAGFLEGHLTREQIQQAINNVGIPETNANGTAFLRENLEFMKKMSQKNQDDVYWYQLDLLLFQLKGMQDGFAEKPGMVANDIAYNDTIYKWNWHNDLPDINLKFQCGSEKALLMRRSCSAIVKNVGNDFVASHVTWTEYNDMLRIIKKYSLQYKKSPILGSTIPGYEVTMSSYPGIPQSADDFYITSANLVVTETTIGFKVFDNRSLYDQITPNKIPYFLAVSLANRLATTGEEWGDIFGKNNLGTYSNQYMIVDMDKYNGGAFDKGTFTVMEQIPGTGVYKDMTHVLVQGNKTWVSFNSPYFKNIRELSGADEMARRHGDFYTFDRAPRNLIFRRDAHKAVDVNSTIALMRYNDFENDPFAKCDCEPTGYSGENGISARCELNPLNGTYAIEAEGARCHGSTDLKITNFEMAMKRRMIFTYGPTHDQQPVFDWREQNNTACKDAKHEGMPDRFDFGPTLISF